jgi:O-acetyl-ADP-ribose deacetylase (regulator of RNase III)
MKAKVNKVTIRLMQGDLMSMQVSGIVNSTDTSLTMPAAMADKAGVAVQRRLAEIGWCPVGSAVITDGGGTGFEKLIHAVGPRWGEGSERGKLIQVTLECLNLAEENKLRSLAIPAISTGAMGYPLENCAKTMLTQIIDYTFEDIKHLRAVVLCLDNDLALKAFQDEFSEQLQELKSAGEGKVQV